jgi:WXG100 family type VII secretion target
MENQTDDVLGTQRGHGEERGERALAGETKVTQSMLTDAGNLAINKGEAITLNLTRLLNELETQAPDFQGSAGMTFQSVSQELGGELRQIIEALNTIAENVHASNKNFGTTDADANHEIQAVAQQYTPGAMNVANSLRG